MYDWPEIRPATDRFWALLRQAIKARGLNAPQRLDRTRTAKAQWQSGNLLFSQTCGGPLTGAFRSCLKLIATPHYDCQGCEGANYASVLIVRRGARAKTLVQLRGKRLAINGTDSHSGYTALYAALAPLSRDRTYFSETIETGTHRQSIRCVARAQADLAAIDPVAWALARRYDRAITDTLDEIGYTPAAPALPFVTSVARSTDEVDALRGALLEVVGSNAFAPLRDTLRIHDVENVPVSAYERISQLQALAFG